MPDNRIYPAVKAYIDVFSLPDISSTLRSWRVKERSVFWTPLFSWKSSKECHWQIECVDWSDCFFNRLIVLFFRELFCVVASNAMGYRLLHWGPIVALSIVSSISAFTILCHVEWWPLQTKGAFVDMFVFLLWNFLTLFNFFRAAFKGPGLVPYGWTPVSTLNACFSCLFRKFQLDLKTDMQN